MDCVVCEKRGGYNRAVVEAETGFELGGLCVRCETERLGELSDELGDPDTETCVYCDRDGLWAVPKWLPATYESTGKTVSYVDYDPSTAALRFCDEHLARLGVDDMTTPETVGNEREYPPRTSDD